eukprot:6173244-Pleurochrysis_carterae.AAC.2
MSSGAVKLGTAAAALGGVAFVAMQSLTNAGLYPEPERKLQRKHSGDMAVFTGDLPASEACLAKDGGKPL